MDIILFILILGVIVACYFYLTRNYNYWSNQDIPYLKGSLPLLGNMWPTISFQMSLSEFITQLYQSYPNHSMVGFYNKTIPALLIREPKLVKTVMQTNFESFSENILKVNPHLDPLFKLNPFFSSGDIWATSRKHMTRAFTTKNLKALFNYVEYVCEKLENYMDKRLKCNSGVIELDLRDLSYKFTREVGFNSCLSMEGFSFKDNPDMVSLFAMCKSSFGTSFYNRIIETLCFFTPEINKIIRIPYVSKEIDRFFRNTVRRELHVRQQDDARRNDCLQFMLNLRNGKGEKLDENTLAAYAFTLFFNIHDTSSGTLSFALYQLARHPHIQQKVRDEVETILARYDGQLTYESLTEMSYMDQVLSESQRFYSTVGTIGKVCTEEFELIDSNGLCCRVKPGMQIIVPVDGFNRDSKYWPDVHTFDPDRFAANRKKEIEKYIFLPFGNGPRICLGKRIALLQIKACVATLVRKYTLEASPKIQEPLKMMSGKFLTLSHNGLWSRVKRL